MALALVATHHDSAGRVRIDRADLARPTHVPRWSADSGSRRECDRHGTLHRHRLEARRVSGPGLLPPRICTRSWTTLGPARRSAGPFVDDAHAGRAGGRRRERARAAQTQRVRRPHAHPRAVRRRGDEDAARQPHTYLRRRRPRTCASEAHGAAGRGPVLAPPAAIGPFCVLLAHLLPPEFAHTLV